MENLLNNEVILEYMESGDDSVNLEHAIPTLLEEALSKIPEKHYSIILFHDSAIGSYTAFQRGIEKSWKHQEPNGEVVTRWCHVTQKEFLEWVSSQPTAVQQQVYQNLDTYIKSDPMPEDAFQMPNDI
jgi:hypothetical protein